MSEAATLEFAESTKKLGDQIAELTLKQAKELSDYLKEIHKIEPAAGGGGGGFAGPGPNQAVAAVAEVQTEFDVILEGFGDKKIGVIKEVRALTNLGLKEAKDLVEGVPSKVKEKISKEEAEKAKKQLVDAGATVSIK